MALASTSNDYGSLKLKNDKKNKSFEPSSLSTASAASGKNLDFYESMYHFKKMFPKFESEVIETVLRANDGAVDKTIDQLLLMSNDNDDIDERIFVDLSVADSNHSNSISQNETQLSNSNTTADNHSNNPVFNDLPPSYNEFLASKMAENSQVCSTPSFGSSSSESSKTSVNLKNSNNQTSSLVTVSLSSLNSSQDKLDETQPRLSLAQSVERSLSLTERKSRVLIGELPNSFLRIKLTTDQIKKFKTNIKKAKREEITAILNNRQTDTPPVSREMKKKLNMLNEQIETEEVLDEKLDSDWESKYKTVSKMYETRRLQIIQDEYLAKLMQNEEFLNEIKTNNDFMQTLHQESNRNEFESMNHSFKNIKSSEKHIELSNAELKSKLLKMGKASKIKLAKLGTTFTRKNKYKEAVEQSRTTCGSIFTDHKFNPLDVDNEDYYESKNSISPTQSNIIDNPLDYSKPSRYQKAYKSFKSVLRRNSSSSIPIGLTIKSTRSNRSSIVEEDFFEPQQQLQKLDSSSTRQDSNSSKFVNDLIVFDDDYSYENKDEINANNFDFSTYPYTKTSKNK